MMFEAFGFSGNGATVQNFISATFEGKPSLFLIIFRHLFYLKHHLTLSPSGLHIGLHTVVVVWLCLRSN